MSDLTPTQVVTLRALSRKDWLDRNEIADRVREQTGSAPSLEGVGQTMSSLVKRRCAERTYLTGNYSDGTRRGRVHWRLTDKGDAARRSY